MILFNETHGILRIELTYIYHRRRCIFFYINVSYRTFCANGSVSGFLYWNNRFFICRKWSSSKIWHITLSEQIIYAHNETQIISKHHLPKSRISDPLRLWVAERKPLIASSGADHDQKSLTWEDGKTSARFLSTFLLTFYKTY